MAENVFQNVAEIEKNIVAENPVSKRLKKAYGLFWYKNIKLTFLSIYRVKLLSI